MPGKSTTNANTYLAFDVDSNYIPTRVKSAFLPPATTLTLGAVRPDGTTITVDVNGVIRTSSTVGTVTTVTSTINAFSFGANPTTTPALTITNAGGTPTTQFLRGDGTWQPVLVSAQATGQAAITGALTLAAGTGVTLTQSGSTITIASSGAGTTSWLVGGNTFTETSVKQLGTVTGNPLSLIVNNTEVISLNYGVIQQQPFVVTGLSGNIDNYFTMASGFTYIWADPATLFRSNAAGSTAYTAVRTLGPAGINPGTAATYSSSVSIYPYISFAAANQHLLAVTDVTGVPTYNDITISPVLQTSGGAAYDNAIAFAVSPNGQNACLLLFTTVGSTRNFGIALTNNFNVSGTTQSFPILNRNPLQTGFELRSVVYRDDNTLFALDASEAVVLYQINVTTGAVTSLGNVAPAAVEGQYLFVVAGSLYVVTLQGLYLVNQTNWTSTLVASISIPGGVSWASVNFNEPVLKLYLGNATSYNIWEFDAISRMLVDANTLQIADGTSTSLGNGINYNSPLLAANAAAPTALTAGTSGQFLTSRGPGLTPFWGGSSSGSGTVTNIGMTVPLGFTVNPSSISTAGVFALAYDGSNKIPPAALGTGQPSSSNFLRGDGTWASSGGGGGTVTQVLANNGITVSPSTSGAASYTVGLLGNSVFSAVGAPGTVAGARTGDFYLQLGDRSVTNPWYGILGTYKYNGTTWDTYAQAGVAMGQATPVTPLSGTLSQVPYFGLYWQHDGGNPTRFVSLWRREALNGVQADFVQYFPPSLDTVLGSGGLASSAVTLKQITVGLLQVAGNATDSTINIGSSSIGNYRSILIQNVTAGSDLINQVLMPSTGTISTKHRFTARGQLSPIPTVGQDFVIDLGLNTRTVRLFAESGFLGGSAGGDGNSADSAITVQFENPLNFNTSRLGGVTANTNDVLSYNGTTWVPRTVAAGGVTQVSLAVPTGFTVTGSPGTGNVALAISYAGQIPTGSLGTGTANNTTFLRGDQTWQSVVSSVQVSGQTALVNGVTFAAGNNITMTQSGNTITIAATGGGGGGFSTVAAVWTGGTATKDAYTSPTIVNNVGITISLTAISNPGVLANATIRLNGALLPNTYAVGGAFPNYTITIPAGDLTGLAAEIAPTVTVAITIGSQFNVTANMLMNNQPVAFNSVFTALYDVSLIPFYTTTANLNYSYSNSGAITGFNGTLRIAGEVTPRNANAASATFTGVSAGGATIGGSVTGNGLSGAGSSTINLSGSVPPVPTYEPAFYVLTSTSTPPTFTTASTQTPGAAAGSLITYPLAAASTDYVWIAIALPLARIQYVTALGNVAFVPDVMAPTQTIAGEVFNVFGATRLAITNPVQLFITAS